MASAQWRTTSGSPRPRIRGRQLQRLRMRLFAAHPYCVLCPKRGTHNLATIRDHRIPLAEGGRDDATNEQPICADCNRIKTAEESARGVRRR
jgi:5-methylcytosine-specific restriction protein A